jgi:hypothetical protein
MPANPLLEVFGYPVTNMSPDAVNHRQGRLCPFHNSSGINCTKNSAEKPLGVCTIRHDDGVAITCPIRFRQDFLIVADAARFFFPAGQRYIVLTEVRLDDRYGQSAGNIDMVLAALDENSRVVDFGCIEVQAVYISGNVTKPFDYYMQNPEAHAAMDWPRRSWPKPDYLSSSRKRLAPQLIFKGGIMRAWTKKTAVVVHSAFFNQLPHLTTVEPDEADLLWLTYDLVYDASADRYRLKAGAQVYTQFTDALDIITQPHPGEVSRFIQQLEGRIKQGRIMGMPDQSEVPPTVEPPSPIGLTDDDDAAE